MEKKANALSIDSGTEKSFAILFVLTKSGETLIRPIGGHWENGINDAVEQMATEYPDCSMKIYEEKHRPDKYFVPNGVPKERVLL